MTGFEETGEIPQKMKEISDTKDHNNSSLLPTVVSFKARFPMKILKPSAPIPAMKIDAALIQKMSATLLTTFLVLGQAQAQNQGAIPSTPQMIPQMTEFWEPEVKVITPGAGTSAPSDAIILFDGKELSKWKGRDGGDAKWQVKDGVMIVTRGAGDISTKQDFEDFQLHIEWSAPTNVVGESQERGNSGIFLQDRYEVQVLDNYNNRTYSNGQAGSLYKQAPPLVNAMRKPGEWNTYDILYTAPRFKESGALILPARVTVIHNGVVIQNNTELKGATEYIGLPTYKPHGKGVLRLQEHGNAVQFRNIWLREL